MTINSNDAFGDQASEGEPYVSGAKKEWSAPVLRSFSAQKSEAKDIPFDFEFDDAVGPS